MQHSHAVEWRQGPYKAILKTCGQRRCCVSSKRIFTAFSQDHAAGHSHQARVLHTARAAGGAHDVKRDIEPVERVASGNAPVACREAVIPGSAECQQTPMIAILSYRERPDIARTAMENIAAAFKDDPSTTYFCRPDKRVQFYRSVLSCLLDWYPDEKQLVCTVPPDAAAVVYVYPRLRELGSWAKLLQGGLAPLACVRLDRLVAGMDSSDFFAEQRENFLKSHGPFMYISVMAVRPDRQGHGLGSALLAFICDRADAAGLHCYIEATSSRNRALYERFGFQLIQEWRANSEMPITYVLSRPPRSLEDECIIIGTDSVLSTNVAAQRPWWQHGGQRRQRFTERRLQQRQRQLKHQTHKPADSPGSDDDLLLYTELDEHSWWPLSPREVGSTSDAEETRGVELAMAAEGDGDVQTSGIDTVNYGRETAAAAAIEVDASSNAAGQPAEYSSWWAGSSSTSISTSWTSHTWHGASNVDIGGGARDDGGAGDD
ncbi:hypothetical protein Vretimale_12749 [Volvox reticuliferus]|uniref:N-acetyltransferase domain-containing protein n=2 Tax=Volvox reticuliferus TaxID=1737510 RepID=A0A8J4CHJ0_9CHLO|nr:hypothetical protein Vretifemale_10245 [Volvox reticuliferus]GIM08800.1 hypothetical protein Vretimale_12749 [Volvox reticuliferus]